MAYLFTTSSLTSAYLFSAYTFRQCYGLDVVCLFLWNLILKYDPQCGNVGRWSLVGGFWIMWVDPHQWLGAVLRVVSECSLSGDRTGSPGNRLVLQEWVAIKPGQPSGLVPLTHAHFPFYLLCHALTQHKNPQAKQMLMPCFSYSLQSHELNKPLSLINYPASGLPFQ